MFAMFYVSLYLLFSEMVTLSVDMWALCQIDYGGTMGSRDASFGGDIVQLP